MPSNHRLCLLQLTPSPLGVLSSDNLFLFVSFCAQRNQIDKDLGQGQDGYKTLHNSCMTLSSVA